ncbi:MAG TPA: site-2 protease family protein [Armatimonadota bacterium]|jgi:Zn-dependent protease
MRGWRIGKVAGIDIEINSSWLLMFFLFAYLFANLLRGAEGLTTAVWIAGGVTSLLFVASVLLHELCHSLVANSLGMSVKRITLFIFGGVSQIEDEAHSPLGEFLMSAAGPACSFALAGLCWGLSGQSPVVTSHAPDLTVRVLALIGQVNLSLAVFNLLPGLPLDGGRVLHSILWAATRQKELSTRIAGGVGSVLGAVFIAGGLMMFLSGGGMGLWMAAIGWLIFTVARAESRHAQLQHFLTGLQVGQLMHWPVVSLPAGLTVEQAVQQAGAASPQPLYPVLDETGRTVGLLSPENLRQLPADQWPLTPISQIMEPLDHAEVTIPLGAPALDALSQMARTGREWLLVVSAEGQPLGTLTDSEIMAAAMHRSPKR